ncbi:TetR/AcrR family transcriptional regulator [Microbacterium sp. NPDC019599]|uniref:TetR/AcrR family transcriptional regulator n=1 Tax=Microbacterium sp. NPDC019599 TaxID=3154690 RepID=UPI0033CA62FE
MTSSTDAPPVRRPRGEYAKTRARKVAILDAALEVFAQSGYRSGSIRDVANLVGISEAGLLHHFPNKVKLLEAVLEHRDEQSRSIVPMGSPDGAETLRGLVELAAYNASVPGVVELYCALSAEATSPDHPAHDYFIRRYDETRASLSAAFGRLRDDGRLSTDVEPVRAAIATIALMDGLQVQWLLDREVVDMAQELSDFFASFVDAFDDPRLAGARRSEPS